MEKDVIILGVGGHGKVIADIVISSGDRIIGFLDDRDDVNAFLGFPVLGKCEQYIEYPEAEFVIAIGNAQIREKLAQRMHEAKWYTAVHPTAYISSIDVSVGDGSVVMPHAVINPGAKIGCHCIVNTGAIVEHDNVLEDFVHVSVGAKLCGTVKIGAKTWVGAGAVVRNNVSVCADCMLGVGAAVVKNITEPGTYVGVPAKKVVV